MYTIFSPNYQRPSPSTTKADQLDMAEPNKRKAEASPVKVVPHDATKLKVADEGNKPAIDDYDPSNLPDNSSDR
jgi:hypothetical protein